MNEVEQYVFDESKVLVWSGFYDEQEIFEILEEMIEEEGKDCDGNLLKNLTHIELQKKSEEEKKWPEETDNDRLDSAFEDLNKNGIIALQDAGYTQSDGVSDAVEVFHELARNDIKGYCFYHAQDIRTVLETSNLYIAFGHFYEDEKDLCDEKCIAVGQIIASILKKHGFDVSWDGTSQTRIEIKNFKWQRRSIE